MQGDPSPSLTNRGFTHQESVAGDVIHFNGRLYDPMLGRFLQADPLIQAPDNLQSWNAYTYVFNNPLRYTDPTGLWGQQEQGWLRMAVAIVISIWTGGAAWALVGTNTGAAFAIAMAGGFAAGYIASNGSLKAGLIGAFGAGLTLGISLYVPPGMQVFAQAASGGIMESLQGGNFGNGFISAGLMAASVPGLRGIKSDVVRTAVGAIIGGTISAATGGKFANGAISGAIQAAMSGDASTRRDEPEGFLDRARALLDKAQDSVLYPSELNDPSVRSGMTDAYNDAEPGSFARRHEEGGFWGFERDGSRGVRRWPIGLRNEIGVPRYSGGLYEGLRVQGEFHIHPNPRPVDEAGIRWPTAPQSGDLSGIAIRRYPGASYIIDNMYIYRVNNQGLWSGSRYPTEVAPLV